MGKNGVGKKNVRWECGGGVRGPQLLPGSTTAMCSKITKLGAIQLSSCIFIQLLMVKDIFSVFIKYLSLLRRHYLMIGSSQNDKSADQISHVKIDIFSP